MERMRMGALLSNGRVGVVLYETDEITSVCTVQTDDLIDPWECSKLPEGEEVGSGDRDARCSRNWKG